MVLILVIGESACGKTTFCRNIQRVLACDVIYPGQKLRQKFSHEELMGGNIPDCIVWDIVLTEMKQAKTNLIFVDGFPISLNQLALLEQTFSLPILAFLFQVTSKNLTKRHLSRDRFDDTPDMRKSRKIKYASETVPVINYLRAKNLIHEVDGNTSITHVLQQCFTKIRETLCEKKINFTDGNVLRVQRMSHAACMPSKAYPFSVGFDLFPTEPKIIPPHMTEKICVDIAVEIPAKTFGLITGRSSLSSLGILVLPGVVDTAFSSGLQVCVTNLSNTEYRIDQRIAIAQFIVIQALFPQISEEPILKSTRGGFGSSNKV